MKSTRRPKTPPPPLNLRSASRHDDSDVYSRLPILERLLCHREDRAREVIRAIPGAWYVLSSTYTPSPSIPSDHSPDLPPGFRRARQCTGADHGCLNLG